MVGDLGQRCYVILSILSLRFRFFGSWSREQRWETFNSLFEILKLRFSETRDTFSPFNSLFEILFKKPKRYRTYTLTSFNSLFEIQCSATSQTLGYEAFHLSILSLRFHGKKGTRRRMEKPPLSILSLRFPCGGSMFGVERVPFNSLFEIRWGGRDTY